MEKNMERLSVCEEEVYLEICWMSEPPALEDVRSAVNRLGLSGNHRQCLLF